MKAAIIRKYGNNDLVQIEDVPKPEVGPTDVLIEIAAASVNPVDYKIRSGALKLVIPQQFPLILGSDLSGVVVEVGQDVSSLAPGDEVYSRVNIRRMGTFAQFVAVHEDEVAKKPQNMSHVEAAAIPLVGLTTWQALHDVVKLQKGEKLLIHAGSGGIGTFAIQLAKYIGAHVATTTSAKNAALVKELGADEIINYREEDFVEKIDDYDVVFDTMGGTIRERSFQVLKHGGRLVSISGLPDPKSAKKRGFPFWIRIVLGIKDRKSMRWARKKDIDYQFLSIQPNGRQLHQITELIEAKHIRSVLDTVYPFDEVKKAIAHVEAGHSRGKVVVKIL